MFRISKLADYGTVVMVYLAKHTALLCNARDIAHHTHLTVPTVSKILKRLAHVGLLVSERGVTGGYRLQRKASEISIADIIFALEDHRGLTQCSLHPGDCTLERVCSITGNWRLINHAIEAALDSVSLEALAKPSLEVKEIELIRELASGVSRGQ